MSSQKYVALDVGATSLKGMEVTVSAKGQVLVTKVATVPLESQVVENSKINDPALLSRALRRLWREGRFRSKLVRLFATGSDVVQNRIVKGVEMQANEDAFRKILPYLVRDYVPFDVEEYYIAPHVLAEYVGQDAMGLDQTYRDVLIAGVEKVYLDTLAKAIRGAGLYPISTDTLAFALTRASYFAEASDPDRAVAVIEIGANETTIVVHKGGRPASINSALIGGAQVTQEISQGLSISYAEAEFLKKVFSLPEEERARYVERILLEGGVPKQVAWSTFTEQQRNYARNLISQQVGNLIEHVDELLDAASESLEAEIDVIVLSGGGTHLFTFAQRLQNELSLPTRFATPFAAVKTARLKPEIVQAQDLFNGLTGLVMGNNA